MKIRFVVNGVVPGFGLPVAAPALRAWGLIQGLRSAGVDARALLRIGTLQNHLQRWSDFNSSQLPDWVEMVNADTLPQAIENADVIVFHNWAAANNVDKPEGCRPRFVYDFFSATLVETFFTSPDAFHMKRVEDRKRDLLKKSDVFIANGAGRQEYGASFLAAMGIEAPVHNIPMSLPWLGNAPDKAAALIGGYQQRWTKPIAGNVLYDLARKMPACDLITVGAGRHHHFGVQPIDRPEGARPKNLIEYDVLSFEDYQKVNASCGAFVDVSPLNDERLISFSTRGVVSIASGCPIIHNAETDLGTLVAQYDAGITLDRDANLSDPTVLQKAIDLCLSNTRREQCHALWEAQFNAGQNAQKFLRILTDD